MDLTIYMANFVLYTFVVAVWTAIIMTVMQVPSSYSRQDLLALRPAKTQLPSDVYKTVLDLGICARLPTRRGCRAGKNKLRPNTTPIITSQTNTRTKLQPSVTDHVNSQTGTVTKSNNTIKAKLCVLNMRSIRNKSTEFVDLVLENKYDIVAITETWLKPGDDVIIGNITPAGYTFNHTRRPNRGGGGVGLLYKSNLSVKIQSVEAFKGRDHE